MATAVKELFEESSSSFLPDDELSDFERRGMEIEAEAAAVEESAAADFREQRGRVEAWDPREEIEPTRAALKSHIDRLVTALSRFKDQRYPGLSRAFYIDMLKEELRQYYSYNEDLVELLVGLFGPEQAVEFMDASEVRRPLTLRVNTLKAKRRDVAQALIARGVSLDPIGSWCAAGLQVFESQVALGATPEYLLGHYMVQGAASFIPVEVLAPQPNTRVADLCAAPGGKTTHIAQKMRNTGTLFANDVSRERLTAVTANAHRLGVTNCIFTCMDARFFPVSGLDAVLVDAPCTGLGVVASDPMIKLQVTRKEIQAVSMLQREILLHALGLLKVGGTLVYSTCSVSLEENEAVVDTALRRCGHAIEVVDFSDAVPFGQPGFVRHGARRFHESLRHARRVYPHSQNLDGFFIAKIVKRAPLPSGADPRAAPAPVQATPPLVIPADEPAKPRPARRDEGDESLPSSGPESDVFLPSNDGDEDEGSDIPSDEALQKPDDRAVIAALRSGFRRFLQSATEQTLDEASEDAEEEEDDEGASESSEDDTAERRAPQAGAARPHHHHHHRHSEHREEHRHSHRRRHGH